MADDHRSPPTDPGGDPFGERPGTPRPPGGQPPPAGGGAGPGPSPEPAGDAGSWPRDYDLAWTLGWGEQPPPAGGLPPGRRPRRRRRRLTPGAFSVIVSLAALALGLVAVLQTSSPDGEGEAVRYVQVRPPEIVGPAPEPGAAPPPPPPVVTLPAQPPVPLAVAPPSEPGAQPAPPLAAPAAPPVAPAAPAPPAAPAAPAPPAPAPLPQEPVVAAAGRVEPSVVLLRTSQGQGSGIIYDAGGLILTAAHVVESAEPLSNLFGADAEGAPGVPRGEDLDIAPSDGLDALDIPGLGGEDGEAVPDVIVQLANGVRTGGKVLAANRELDVAVVQVDPALDLAVADIGSLSTVQVGQTAVAVGSPFGMENVVTVGVVSAVNRVLGGPEMPPLGMIQTDAPINFGNSGGALADLQGRVIGMNVAIQSTVGGGNIGVGFATPIEVAIWIAEELRAGREVRFGFLGITGYTPDLGDPGAIVASVTPGGPAEAAGMQVNDRVVSFDGQAVGSMDELAVAVRLRAPGTEVVVEVVRDDLLIRLFVPLGDRGESLDMGAGENPEDPAEP